LKRKGALWEEKKRAFFCNRGGKVEPKMDASKEKGKNKKNNSRGRCVAILFGKKE